MLLQEPTLEKDRIEKKAYQRLAVLLVVALVVVRMLGSLLQPFYDDAYITLTYARNLLAGKGLVFNVGENVNGLTTPLYGLLLAALHWIVTSPKVLLLGVGLVCDSLTLLFTLRLFRKHSLDLAGILFALCYIICPIITRLGVGGMESSLFVLLLVLSLSVWETGHYGLTAIIASLTVFVRPEASILVAVYGCMVLWNVWKKKERSSVILRFVLPVIVAISCGGLLLYHTYGAVIPQSVVAKSHLERVSVWSVIQGLLLTDPFCIALFPFAVIGLFVRTSPEDKRLFLPLTIFIGLFLIAYLTMRPPIYKWYGAPVHYWECLLGAVGLLWILQRRRTVYQHAQKKIVHCSLIAVSIAAIVLLVLLQRSSGSVEKNVYDPLREWYRTHDLHGKSILADDIGFSGYYSGAYIYDPYGLVFPPALRYPDMVSMIEHYKPNYLLLYLTPGKIEMLRDTKLLSEYHPLKRFAYNADTTTALLLDPNFYWRERKQDYLLLERSNTTTQQTVTP